MADKHHLALLKEGPETWNAWRASDPNARPDLSDLNFEKDVWEAEHLYDLPTFEGVDFSNCNLRRIVARNSSFGRCRFDGCALQFSDLCFSQFDECSFCNVEMQVAKIGSAVFRGCVFDGTNLSYCTAEETDFSGSRFSNSMFDNMSLVKTCFTGCELDGVSVYGISAWDLILDDTVQKEIVIPGESSAITLDNIELAQFIHLLIRNSRLRSVIDTITSKVVLILGRFTPDRKPVLDAVRSHLGQSGYVPVLFDFAGPTSRDLTETVSTLAHLSRFVIVDMTDPKSVPHELSEIVSRLPSVPVQPIIEAGQRPFAMYAHFERYPWVMGLKEYTDHEIQEVVRSAIVECEANVRGRGG